MKIGPLEVTWVGSLKRRVRRMIVTGDSVIHVIKYVREVTGWGLKRACEYVAKESEHTAFPWRPGFLEATHAAR